MRAVDSMRAVEAGLELIAAEGLVAYMVSRKVGAQIGGVREFANMAG